MSDDDTFVVTSSELAVIEREPSGVRIDRSSKLAINACLRESVVASDLVRRRAPKLQPKANGIPEHAIERHRLFELLWRDRPIAGADPLPLASIAVGLCTFERSILVDRQLDWLGRL